MWENKLIHTSVTEVAQGKEERQKGRKIFKEITIKIVPNLMIKKTYRSKSFSKPQAN